MPSFGIWAPKLEAILIPTRSILATQMLSSVAALSPAGYTSPMALPQSQVKASMASLDQLKDLAKSQNPVVVSCRKQPRVHGCASATWTADPGPYPLLRATGTR